VVLAHSRRREDENAAVRLGPYVIPSLLAQLVAYCDWILYQSITLTGERQIQCLPKGQTTAKDRRGVLEAKYTDTNLYQLITKVKEQQ
jgi:hypothetical protein